MPMSEAKRAANKRWNDANMKTRYERIQLVVPNGRKATIEKLAKVLGQSVNGMINTMLFELAGMTADEWKTTPADETNVSVSDNNMTCKTEEADKQDSNVSVSTEETDEERAARIRAKNEAFYAEMEQRNNAMPPRSLAQKQQPEQGAWRRTTIKSEAEEYNHAEYGNGDY